MLQNKIVLDPRQKRLSISKDRYFLDGTIWKWMIDHSSFDLIYSIISKLSFGEEVQFTSLPFSS